MNDFLGNEKIRKQLGSLLEADRLHGCLLFEGPSGVGKSTTAMWLAMLANCDDSEIASRPCGGCWSCRQIPKGQHPDIVTIGVDPTKTAPIISVGQSRQLIGQLTVKPFHARRRFVIIDPADAMTSEAANALLKTFEDPPSQTHFILVTSAPVSLLLTVRSRSQRVRFGPVDESILANWLEQKGVDNSKEVARLSEGCPGRALELDIDGVKDWRHARDAFVDALRLDAGGRFRYSETLCKGDRTKWLDSVENTMDAVSSLLRDALAVSHNGTVLYNDDRMDVVADWSVRLGPVGVSRLSLAVASARLRLNGYVSGRVVMDAFVSEVVKELEHGGQRAPV